MLCKNTLLDLDANVSKTYLEVLILIRVVDCGYWSLEDLNELPSHIVSRVVACVWCHYLRSSLHLDIRESRRGFVKSQGRLLGESEIDLLLFLWCGILLLLLEYPLPVIH